MSSRKTWVFAGVGAIVVVVILVLSLLVSGIVFLQNDRVELGPLQPGGQGQENWLHSSFDGGVKNAPASEAGYGTGMFTLGFEYYPKMNMLQVIVAVSHADATRVRNLRLRLKTPPEWGQPLFELPGGDGWGAIRHAVTLDGLVLEFDNLASDTQGAGTVELHFTNLVDADTLREPGATVTGELAFDLSGTGWRRFTRWQVHSTFEVPVTAKMLGL